jgi:hypothetical protein
MAFATVYFIPSNKEPLFWLPIFIITALILIKYGTTNYFMQGLVVSLLNCVWITSVHILLYKTYLVNHSQEAIMISKMPLPDSPRLMMLLTGPVVGIFSGFVLGLITFALSKVITRRNS